MKCLFLLATISIPNEILTGINQGRRVGWSAGAGAPPKKKRRKKKENLQKVSILTFKLLISLLKLFFTNVDI